VASSSYRRTLWCWALYDVAHSAFFLTVVAAIFPLFYQDLYVHRHAGKAAEAVLRTRGGSALAYTAGAAMVVVAVLGPLLGGLADRTARKKAFLAAFAALGVASTAALAFLGSADVEAASILYALATVGAAGSIVFYDALLPLVAKPEDFDRASSLGFAAGYLGSVLLFIAQSAVLLNPSALGLSGPGAAARLAFASVAVWWAAFTVPLLRGVPEPAPPGAPRATRGLLRGRGPLLLFLAAFWLYSDGVGTIIKMATAFGNGLGLRHGDLLGALVLTQVVGVPCAIGFGRLARRAGAKRTLLGGLVVYTAICLGALFVSKGWHFWVLAGAVGVVQGGVQALSRSIYASMIPAERSAAYFGLFSTMEKFAGILGPLVLGALWSGGEDPRRGVGAIAAFFVLGALLLLRVDVDAGRRQAAA
jgi:UMF1 family MFS transporter